MRHWMTASGLLVMAMAAGCRKGAQDTTKVLANVGGTKITQAMLETSVRALAPNEAQAKEFLTAEGSKAQRQQFLERMAQSKALVQWAKLEGLDQDPKAQILVEQAQAEAYFRLAMDRRLSKVDPTDAQLKAMYDERVKSLKDAKSDMKIPPFEEAKPQIADVWRQQQAMQVQETFLKELKNKVAITYAEAPAPAPAPVPSPAPAKK